MCEMSAGFLRHDVTRSTIDALHASRLPRINAITTVITHQSNELLLLLLLLLHCCLYQYYAYCDEGSSKQKQDSDSPVTLGQAPLQPTCSGAATRVEYEKSLETSETSINNDLTLAPSFMLLGFRL